MARLGCPFKVVPVQFIKLSCHKSICLNHEQRNTRRLLVEYRLAVKAWLVCLSTPMCLTEWCPEFALYHIVHTKVFNKERWVTDRKCVKIVFLRVLQLKDSSDRHVLLTTRAYLIIYSYNKAISEDGRLWWTQHPLPDLPHYTALSWGLGMVVGVWRHGQQGWRMPVTPLLPPPPPRRRVGWMGRA